MVVAVKSGNCYIYPACKFLLVCNLDGRNVCVLFCNEMVEGTLNILQGDIYG